MPPWASSTRPLRWMWAPVNAPFSWPNSSLSSRLSGIAPQLMAMNGPSPRLPLRWIASAASSLPVPFSPVISTGASVVATLRIAPKTSWICGLVPSIPSKEPAATRCCRSRYSRSRRATWKARERISLSSSTCTGFGRKS